MSRSRSLFSALAFLFALLLVGPSVASAQQGTPAPGVEGVTTETLLQQTLPPDELPPGETFIGFFHVNSDAGYQEDIKGEEAVGPALVYMLDGTLAVQSEAPLRITRADSSVEEVPANTEAKVTVGEWVFFHRGAHRLARVEGTEPAEYLVGLIIPPGPPPPPRPGIHSLPVGFIGTDETSQLPAGGRTVTIERITVAPNGQFSIGPGPSIVGVRTGSVALTPSGRMTYTKGLGEDVTPGPNMTRPDTIAATPGAGTSLSGSDAAVLGAGTTATAINNGNRDALVWVMTISAAGPEEATPVA